MIRLAVADRFIRRQRDRIGDDAVLAALDLVHLARLLRDRHVLVNDADAPFLGQGDGQVAFGDRVHRRRHDGDVDANVARDLGADVRLAGRTSLKPGSSRTSSKVMP